MAASIHGKRKMDVSSGSSKLQRISLDDDISIRESSHVESGLELRKNPQADISYINNSNGLAAAFDLEAQENMQVPDADADVVAVDDDHLEKKTDDGTDKVADMNRENDVKKKVTKISKVLTEGSEKLTCKSDKADSDPKWFIFTGNSLQTREFQQLIRRLKGGVCNVSHQWSYLATHFIVPDPIKRTAKLFAAAASGRWILKTDYLTASDQAGKFLAEEPYEWHGNGLNEDERIDLQAPRKWRLLKEKTGYGAFHGMRIVIHGECTTPSLDTLKRAVKAGDGTILATSPPYTRFLDNGIDFAVVSPDMPSVNIWVQWFLRSKIPCISADYLVEYVCKPGYPLDGHVRYGTNDLAERSYNNLKKRLDEEDNTGNRTRDSYDVACEVCGLHDRGKNLLICGDKIGSIGCGVGAHIDCCDPPLDDQVHHPSC